MKFFIKTIQQHFSFFIIICGAGSFFISNIILKEIFTPQQYGNYSIFITYISLISIFGLLGLEQIFIRYSEFLSYNKITTQKFQIRLIFTVIIISSIISCFFFNNLYFYLNLNIILVLFSSMSIISLLYFYNVFRLNSDFILSQILNNLWKIILLGITSTFLIFEIKDFILFINIIMISIISTNLLAAYFYYKRIKFIYNEIVSKKIIYSSSVQFLVSITSFSLLLFGDRFLIEYKFGINEFGNYFYLTNFFLAPFSIFQNYIGFKQLIAFKNNFNKELLNKISKKTFFLGTMLSIILFIIPKFICYFRITTFNFNDFNFEIILILILGNIRLYNATINSAFEARTDLKTLEKANFRNIIISATIIIITFVFFNKIELIIISFIMIWVFRSIITRRLLVGQIIKEI